MIEDYFLNLLKKSSKVLYDRGFIGLYHGAVSARNTHQSFIINSKSAFLNALTKESLIELDFNPSKVWENASHQANIHAKIYTKVPSAKFISSIFATSIITASLVFDEIVPIDYFGKILYDKIPIYDPKAFSDWDDRAPHELSEYFKNSKEQIIIIKGVGLYCANRDLDNMIRNIAVINKTCEVLLACENIAPSKHCVL